MYDAEKHPELYYVIESRPQDIQEANLYISIIPEWHYRASTIQECKPMINLQDKFDRYMNPAWKAFIILAVAGIQVFPNRFTHDLHVISYFIAGTNWI